MEDKIFGQIRQEDDGCWTANKGLKFGENICSIEIMIFDDDEQISEEQRNTFVQFINNWTDIQEKLIKELIRYYNEEERFSYGPDDEEELAEWWPEINTKKALLQAVELETIVIPDDFLLGGERRIYLLFSRTWGGEDLDDNGIGVCFVNEEVDNIGYKDIAF